MDLSPGLVRETRTYPGNRDEKGDNRKAVASSLADGAADLKDAGSVVGERSRVAVGTASGRGTQGNLAGSATLGWGTESLWDSGALVS